MKIIAKVNISEIDSLSRNLKGVSTQWRFQHSHSNLLGNESLDVEIALDDSTPPRLVGFFILKGDKP